MTESARPPRKTLSLRKPRTPEPAPLAARRPAVARASTPPDAQPPDAQQPDAQFDIFCPCPGGLEEVLSTELQSLGLQEVHVTRGGCHARANWTGIMLANLGSRIAARVLVRVARAPIQSEHDILRLAQHVDWETWFGPDHALRVDTTAVKSPLRSLNLANLKVKDGICDRLRDAEGARPSIDTVRPDARVFQFLDATHTTLYIDTSGESLFKRGWRLDKGEAPLRENLAAGLLALAGWHGQAPLIDPFCGSGTLAIEATLIALGVPPGVMRPLGFERLRVHDDPQFEALRSAALARVKPELPVPILGCDLNARQLELAQANAERAGLAPDLIEWRCQDAANLTAPEGWPAGWIVTNPPYGERIGEQDTLQALWPQFARQLKQGGFAHWQAWIISADRKLPSALRLDPARKIPVWNGDLECRLFGFKLVQGRYQARPGATASSDPKPAA